MKRNIAKRLDQAWKDINSVSITRPMVVRLLTIYGGNREQACKVYESMEQDYVTYLKARGLVNPGTLGIPNAVALEKLKLYGITKTAIRSAMESEGIK